MITPAPSWLYASYKDDSDGSTRHHRQRVIGFDEDGTALVITGNERRLVPADSYDNFAGIEDFGPHYNDLTTIIPPGGWRVEFTHEDGGTEDMPLAEWGVTGTGTVVPLAAADGEVNNLTTVAGKWRVYHPDTKATPAPHEGEA
jgi:hypothetical protein